MTESTERAQRQLRLRVMSGVLVETQGKLVSKTYTRAVVNIDGDDAQEAERARVDGCVRAGSRRLRGANQEAGRLTRDVIASWSPPPPCLLLSDAVHAS